MIEMNEYYIYILMLCIASHAFCVINAKAYVSGKDFNMWFGNLFEQLLLKSSCMYIKGTEVTMVLLVTAVRWNIEI